MTEKKKIIVRRKVLKLSAVFFIASLGLGSCKKEATPVGDGLEGSSLGISLTDTFSLETYTENVDSIETDETAVNLLGSYIDPVFGKVDCGIVTEMRLSSASPVFGPTGTLTMDSVVLSLRYTSINYYANVQPMTFEVYRITNDLDRDADYYAFSPADIDGADLVKPGFETIMPEIIKPQIVGDDTLPAHLRVHLDPAFGMTLVNAKDAGFMTTDDVFSNWFKGLYIKVDGSGLPNSQGTVLYTVLENSVSGVTMYFKDNGTPKEYSFEFNSSGARFNKMDFDRTGTDVADAISNPSLADAFYAQGSTLRGVIKIPHLMNFNYDSLGNWDPKVINKAELILPVQDFTADVFNPSAKIFIAKIVDDHFSTATLDYAGSSTSLLSVNYDAVNKEYRFMVTREVQAMLSGARPFNGFRVYSPAFFGSTIERIVFNGSGTTLKEKPRLEITYTNY